MHSNDHLIWLDLEMTGLDPSTDRIIEIATVITDKQLSIIAEGPNLAIHQTDEVLSGMDEWNQTHHGNSGLLERVKDSDITEEDATKLTLEFLRSHIDPKQSPMCGNSICQDRRFLANYMPELENYFHYRNLDVTSVKIIGNAWMPRIIEAYKKYPNHTALADVYDSINELRFYKEKLFIKTLD